MHSATVNAALGYQLSLKVREDRGAKETCLEVQPAVRCLVQDALVAGGRPVGEAERHLGEGCQLQTSLKQDEAIVSNATIKPHRRAHLVITYVRIELAMTRKSLERKTCKMQSHSRIGLKGVQAGFLTDG